MKCNLKKRFQFAIWIGVPILIGLVLIYNLVIEKIVKEGLAEAETPCDNSWVDCPPLGYQGPPIPQVYCGLNSGVNKTILATAKILSVSQENSKYDKV